MSDPNFESIEVQAAMWRMTKEALFAATDAALETIVDAFPTTTDRATATRNGLVHLQLHEILAQMVGLVEGRLLRQSSVPEDNILATRERGIMEGRVGVSEKT